jgi:hypothetical protein
VTSVDACVHCKKPLRGCFEVTRWDVQGEHRGAVRVCSLICLVQWSYAYTIQRGVEGVVAVQEKVASTKDFFDRLGAFLRG